MVEENTLAEEKGKEKLEGKLKEKAEEKLEEKVEEIEETTKKGKIKKRKTTKKNIPKTKITVTKVFAYFIIYSVIGYIIETGFALITKGVLESRKSFLYGPFCAIYGLGATTMIIGLQKFNKNNYTLFFGGVLIGSVVEYLVSWIGEMIFHIKWWDYSNIPFNINGRICIAFSIIWGILAIYLMHFNPHIDKLLSVIPTKVLKPLTYILTIFLFTDWIISSFAVQMFYVRLTNQKDIELQQSAILEKYDKLYNENETINKIVNTFFSDNFMIKSFPNLKVTTEKGEVVYAHDFFPEIQTYYFKLFTPRLKENK